MHRELLRLLEDILGESYNAGKGNHAFYCPFCNHSKQKLQVNIESYKWHCWVCDNRGLSIFSLLKRLEVRDKSYYQEVSNILEISQYHQTPSSDVTSNRVKIPDEFKPLYKPVEGIEGKLVLNYLRTRGISKDIIYQYRLGYCTSGHFADRIIIPTYNSKSILSYFSARSYRSHIEPKYINPDVSRDIIFFENLINFDEELNIVEGPFDTMTLGGNTTYMSGLRPSKSLKLKIIQGQVQRINVIYDLDVDEEGRDLREKDRMYMVEWIHSIGKTPHLIKLPAGEDPNSLGKVKIRSLIQSTPAHQYEDTLKEKIDQLWYS